MYPRQSSKIGKGPKEEIRRSPSPNESIHHKWKKKKKRALGKTKVDDSGANTDDERDCDTLDIDSTQQKDEEEELFTRVDDEGVDFSGDDWDSISSICSGPSVLQSSDPRKQIPSRGVCSVCWNLYKKAKKVKAPNKNKVDNDPNSLTCDQWVLLKKWRPKRASNTAGQLLALVHLVKKRLAMHAKTTNPLRRENKLPACLRQHVFLQRNLAKVLKVPAKPGRKMNRRKRPRDDSLGPRAVKQQRFHSGGLAKHAEKKIAVVKTDSRDFSQSSSQSTISGSYGWSEQESDGADSTYRTVELISSSVNVQQPLKPLLRVQPKAPKKAAGFRDLLAQMRANTSAIVREPYQ